MVEQLTLNQLVVGSSPSRGTNRFLFPPQGCPPFRFVGLTRGMVADLTQFWWHIFFLAPMQPFDLPSQCWNFLELANISVFMGAYPLILNEGNTYDV